MGGFDETGRGALWFRDEGGQRREVPHVVSHSPDGLAWGYEGSGPADTALSILADITQDQGVAERWHQEFKREVVARLSLNQPFELERGSVEQWLAGKGVAIAAEWDLADRPTSMSAPGPLEERHAPVATAAHLTQRSAALDARERSLDAREAALDLRERGLDRRDLRAETWEASLQGATGTEPRWTLPAGPVKGQIETLLVLTHDDLSTVARGINVEPEWAVGVMDGSITEVDVDHVQRLCHGLHCTPYDFWGAEAGRSILHAYGPELWPRYIEPLAAPGPDLGGPELGL
ncbi:MAG: DUF6166 domain-containing protein [Acidimicrobiales bacterium]